MTRQLQYVCMACQHMYPFHEALQHQDATGHSVELFATSDNPYPFMRLFIEKYWYRYE